MAYSTISHWTTTEWNDDLESIARDKFVPMILSVGAARVQMIQTGDMTFSVVTEYADEAAAKAAQDRSLRSELKLLMSCQCLCLEPLRVLYSPAVNLLTPPEDRS